MVFDKMFSFCFFTSIKNRLLTPFYILYKSFPSSQSQLTKEQQKVVFTLLLSTQPKPAHFLRLFHPLASRCPYNAHPTTKKRNRQPAHPSKPAAAACQPAGPNPFIYRVILFIYYILQLQRKSFNDLELTRTISLISLSKLPLFFCPGSLKIKSALFSRDLIQQERVQSHYLLLQYTYTIYNIYYIQTPYEHFFVHCGYPILQHSFWVEKYVCSSKVFITNQNCSSLYFQIFIRPMLFK